jgi:two-component system, OmpR family, osmolarity sensor histidine kinase EnvZ
MNAILRRLFPKTLLARFALIIILPALIGQMAAVQVFYYRHWYHVSNYSSRIIAQEIKSLIVEERYHVDISEPKKYLNLTYEFHKAKDLPSLPNKMIEELEYFKQELQRQVPGNVSLGLTKDRKIIEIFLQINREGVLKISIPAKALVNPSTYVFLFWFLLQGIILLAISLLFTRNQIKSILELTNAAETYGKGGAIKDFKPSGAKEIRRAGLAFLKMKDRIERQATKRTQMLAMISHDLKTPLTRMKLQVELMDDCEEKEELQYDIDSMQHMIASYLDFARGEGGELFKEVEINSWIQQYISNNWSGKISVELGDQECFSRIKPHSFIRALTNLIDNAIKHSTKVQIAVYSDNENVFIDIEDNGPGIADKDKHNVFKPFYRADKARPLDSFASVGLGLTITREIIRGHYGNISLYDSSKLGGLLVRIKIPRINS